MSNESSHPKIAARSYCGIFTREQYERWRSGEGFIVLSRDGTEKGRIANPMYGLCSMAGCKGVRVRVIWPDKKETRPCSEGLKQISDDTWQII